MCKSGNQQSPVRTQPKVEYAVQASEIPSLTSFSIKDLKVNPTPTITAQISTPNGEALLTALPDSGADVLVAGLNIIEHIYPEVNGMLLS
jgi:hypothetical protein